MGVREIIEGWFLINGGGTPIQTTPHKSGKVVESQIVERKTHAEVEDRTANVEEEEDQSVCSENVVGEGDVAEVMQDLLLVLQRRTMSQPFVRLQVA